MWTIFSDFMLTVAIYSLLGTQVIVCLLMILTVLMQRPKNEGLGAAFGGGMTENLFGAQTTSVLANFTRWLGGGFLLLTLTLSILYAKQSTTKSLIQQQLMSAPKGAAAASPALAAPSPASMGSWPGKTQMAQPESAPPAKPSAAPSVADQ